jgi:hypothetical protein
MDLVMLIQRKLTAGRFQDYADVVNLIRDNGLNEAFQEKLPPSFRGDFLKCVEEIRREAEYQARQDQALEELCARTPKNAVI